MPRDFTDNSWQRTELKNFALGLWDESIVSRASVEDGACVEVQDVEFLPKGGMSKRAGIAKKNASIAASASDGTGGNIIKLYQWQTPAGSDLILAWSNQTTDSVCSGIYTVDTGASDTIFTPVVCHQAETKDWTPDGTSQIIATSYMGSAVFTYGLTNGMPLVYTGTGQASGVRAAPSGVHCLESWADFLIAGNYTDTSGLQSSRVGWCYPGNPWANPLNADAVEWPAAYYIDLDPEDGDQIVAMKAFQNSIVVFKRSKMYQLSWVGGTTMFDYNRISTEIGCNGPDAVCEHMGKLWWLGPKGFYVWDGSQAPQELSIPISPQITNVDTNYAHFCFVQPYKKNNQIWVTIPKVSTDCFDNVYVYDYTLNCWTRFNMSAYCLGLLRVSTTKTFASYPEAYSHWSGPGDVISSTSTRGRDMLALGYAGYLKEYGVGTSDDGVAIDAYWRSGWLDWDIPDRNKRLMRTTFLVSVQGNTDYNLNVQLYKDWDWETPQWGISTNDLTGEVDLYQAGEVSEKVVERRWDKTLYMRALQLMLGTDKLTTPFTVHRIIVDWIAKGRTKG
jgi:hypothetical protein